MNKFLMRVYNTTGISILGALGSSFMFMSMPLVIANFGTSAIVSLVMTLGGFIGASYMKPTNVVENVNGVEIFKTVNSPLRIGLYSMGVLGLGLGASPLFMVAQAMSPTIMPTALGITTAIFGGASLAAYSMPKDKMLGFGRVLSGSLLGLIGLQLVGLLTTMAIGPNALSSFLFTADSYIGIGLFSALIAYDTHVAIKMYEMREADHLGMAVQFLLDFWNILVRVVSIFTRD
jgi:FtsH-binding integral membrane protein